MSIVLGFNAFIHDTAACLVEDGKLLFFLEEERITRQKHTNQFPQNAIEWCLQKCGIGIKDVDAAAFYWQPYRGLIRRIAQTLKYFPDSIVHLKTIQAGNFHNMATVESAFRKLTGFNGPFFHVDHHLAHAAGAYYPSGMDEAAVLVADGNGEIASTSFFYGKNGRLKRLGEVLYPHSMGLVWCSVTEHLGFAQNRDEGKVMGLAAHGDERFVKAFRSIVFRDKPLSLKLDLSFFDFYKQRKTWTSEKFAKIICPRKLPDEELNDDHRALAFACQKVTQEIMIALVQDLMKTTRCSNICINGGVALNCVANGQIAQLENLNGLFIPPPAYDAGAAWGAALFAAHSILGPATSSPLEHPFYGPEFSDEEIAAAFQKAGIAFERKQDIVDSCAKLLAKGAIIGWFQDKAEMGPRALGHRSILADPRFAEIKHRLNKEVKLRESWRPYAPAVPSDDASQWFITNNRESPFMLITFDFAHGAREKLKAVDHPDGRARVQTVRKELDPKFYNLLKAFGRITGVPILLNTSFNRVGEPIVLSPSDAIGAFLHTGMDALAMSDFLASK